MNFRQIENMILHFSAFPKTHEDLEHYIICNDLDVSVKEVENILENNKCSKCAECGKIVYGFNRFSMDEQYYCEECYDLVCVEEEDEQDCENCSVRWCEIYSGECYWGF